jgi:hypothetical protein
MNKKIPSFEDLGLNELDARDRSLYLMWESSHYRAERVNFRLWIVILVLIVALVGTNVGWFIYESQWQTVEATTITQSLDSGDGGNAIINDGVHINGESKTDSIDN